MNEVMEESRGLIVRFKDEAAYEEFQRRIGKKLPHSYKHLHYKKEEVDIESLFDVDYNDGNELNG